MIRFTLTKRLKPKNSVELNDDPSLARLHKTVHEGYCIWYAWNRQTGAIERAPQLAAIGVRCMALFMWFWATPFSGSGDCSYYSAVGG